MFDNRADTSLHTKELHVFSDPNKIALLGSCFGYSN